MEACCARRNEKFSGTRSSAMKNTTERKKKVRVLARTNLPRPNWEREKNGHVKIIFIKACIKALRVKRIDETKDMCHDCSNEKVVVSAYPQGKRARNVYIYIYIGKYILIHVNVPQRYIHTYLIPKSRTLKPIKGIG